MDETYSFGYWVRRRRKALDLTQAALARDVGCATVTIRKIENDERRPSQVMAERLAACLDIPEDDQETFILSGLGEVSAARMPVLSKPISISLEAENSLQSEGAPSISESSSRSRNNLPAQATTFIGREKELTEIRVKLGLDDCRLLTLLGPGGSGKTRLAIEAAGGLLTDYQDGIYFVSLAPVQSVEVIPTAIAATLKFSFHSEGTPHEQLLNYLRNKQMLLILDNFEHLLDGACLVLDILNSAPSVKILATSRARLMVTGEHIFDVWGLAYPESSIQSDVVSAQFSAIQLFETHASQVQMDFYLSDNNLADVIEVCAILEGMPLGIVLAASWVSMLTPAEIAAEIPQDFEFLEKDLRDLPPRQRSLRSVFNHSWRLLSADERQIMAALSVFRGGFNREAAREVAGASLNDLVNLIDKSMLQRIAAGRYEVHELMRQFAAEKLENDSNRDVDIRSKHSKTFLQALANWERDLQGPRQIEATKEMKGEIDNIRAAWTWAVENFTIKSLAGAINGYCIYLFQSHQRVEGDEVCQTLVDRLNSVSDPGGESSLLLKARALAWSGFFNWKLGNWDHSEKLLQKCLSTLKRSELVEVETRFEKALFHLTQFIITEQVVQPENSKIIEDVAAQFMAIDESWWAGWALRIMGERNTTTREGLYILGKSLQIAREMDDLRGIADTLVEISGKYSMLWQLDKGFALEYEALEIYRELGDQHRVATMHANLGSCLVWVGKFEEARTMENEALDMSVNLGYEQSFFAWAYAAVAYPDLYLGEYQVACEQARFAIEIYKHMKHNSAYQWTTGAKDVLGRAALAEGAYTEAENWFQECYAVFQGFSNPADAANIGQYLAFLGFANRGLNQPSRAQDYLYQALRVAIKFESYIAIYHILPGIALLFSDQGWVERAVELYTLAATQGIVANSKWFADIAGDEIAGVASQLPLEVVEDAKARGRQLDLWETAADLLKECEQMEWDSSDN